MLNFTLDKEFLYELNQYQHKEIYAKIISLSFNEQPLEQIEGKITGGSINIDGDSTIRRSCDLSLVAQNININNFYWRISNKFELEIGLKNFINSKYPEIIWFKQGKFVITSFNSVLTNNNYTISISGKDKMCLLNGDIGGSLPASIDFGKIDSYSNSYSRVKIEDYTQYKSNKYYIYKNGEYQISLDEYNPNVQYYVKDTLLEQKYLRLKDIIREAIHFYGKEPYGNIVINDLDDYGLELLEYRGDTPLYLFYNEEEAIYDQMTIDQDFIVGDYTTSTIPHYNTAVDKLNQDRTIFILKTELGDKPYSLTKIEYGQTAGYRITDLIYAGELISSIGETLTSILDKIVKMLGAFEYFYDVYGKFIFQAKKIYTQTFWNSLVEQDNNIFARDMNEVSEFSYSFEDMNLIQRFQNTPSINTLKNDYSVWGVRKSVSGAEIPIHARYAIQKKPEYYKSFEGKIYCSNEEILEKIKELEKNQIIEDVNNRIEMFEPIYEIPEELTKPIKQEDGSWTPGWWDIRDWHDYYYALRQEEPSYTMKWYSHNSIKGCVPALSLKIDYGNYFKYIEKKDYVWLLIYIPSEKIYNPQHGYGNPEEHGRTCSLWESHYTENGEVKTQQVQPPEYKDFIPPFSGCSDNHTYLEFLSSDIERKGNLVYFYNPNFPGVNSFEEAVQDQIDKEFNEALENGKINLVDWREIIYQMAVDYYKYGQQEDFLYQLKNNNANVYYKDDTQTKKVSYYPSGETGYEIFYSDIQGFWRQLYNPEPEIIYDSSGGYYSEEKDYEENGITYKIITKWNPFKKLPTFKCDYFLKPKTEEQLKDYENYSSNNYYWNKNVINAPELLNFWMEFYEGNETLSQYSVSAIGDRTKVVNDSKITSVYFRNIPNVIFTSPEYYDPLDIKTGYFYIWLDDSLENLFNISAQGKSAEEEINNLFNQYSYCTESISITTIPIYNLEPNTLIHLHNEDIGINGKYQVKKISIPLSYNGVMTITANKITDLIY